MSEHVMTLRWTAPRITIELADISEGQDLIVSSTPSDDRLASHAVTVTLPTEAIAQLGGQREALLRRQLADLDVERTAPCTGCETAYDTCELGPGIKCCPDCAHVVPAKHLAEARAGVEAGRGLAECLRALLVEALDGWEHTATHHSDGYRDRERIRKAAGL